MCLSFSWFNVQTLFHLIACNFISSVSPIVKVCKEEDSVRVEVEHDEEENKTEVKNSLNEKVS